MTKALENLPSEPFPEPEGIKRVQVSRASGKLPGAETPSSMIFTDIFASFSVPTEVENLFFKVKLDKISGLLATEFTPPDALEEVTFQNYEEIADMLNWNEEVRNFYNGKSLEEKEGESQEGSTIRAGLPPTEFDNIHTAETAKNAPTVTITSPVSQSTIGSGNLKVDINLKAPNGVNTVEYYLDDEKKFFTTSAPYTGQVNISKFIEPNSKHLLVVKVIDSLGYSTQSAIEIKISNTQEPIDTPAE